jgi:p-hydroxybenzoate 3-monooxygenase
MEFRYTRVREFMHTQVGIIGAGPAGLLLGHLLHLKGIDSVVLESRTQDYVIDRVPGRCSRTVHRGSLDTEMGVGDRLHRDGMRHDSVFLSLGGKRHHVPLAELTGGKAIYVYGQNEVVKDLMQARLATGRPLHYEVEKVSVHDIDSTKPNYSLSAQWPTTRAYL